MISQRGGHKAMVIIIYYCNYSHYYFKQSAFSLLKAKVHESIRTVPAAQMYRWLC